MAKNLFSAWLKWHFVEVPKFLVGVWSNYLNFYLDYFSIPLLLKTIFSPWKRYNWSYPKIFDIAVFFNTLVSNIFSRFLGFIFRVFLIFIGLVWLALAVTAGAVMIILWIVLPFAAIAGGFLVVPLLLLVWEFYLFFKYNRPKNYQAQKIARDAVAFCKKRRIPVNSTALFYACVARKGGDVATLCGRLGLDVSKLRIDLKNYLEKIPRNSSPEEFTEDFNQVMAGANTDKDIFMGLAKYNQFFKKVMQEGDLKEEDINNISFWLNSAERIVEFNKKFWSRENLSRAGSVGRDWACGYTINLDRFSVDWREIVSNWACREILGHQKEVEQTELILARSSQTNALIIGEPGTGRKSIIQALAQKAFLGSSLPELNQKRIMELDMTHLTAQIQDPEKLEYLLDQIFHETLASGNVILVIENLHSYLNILSGILPKYLAMRNFQFIGITDYNGLHRNLERAPSFLEFFQKVEVAEISQAETIIILQDRALELEKKYKILITYPSLREIVNLTARYFPSVPFPKKALDVLEECAVYAGSVKDKAMMPHHVAKIISDKTQIPVGKMDFKEKEVLLNLENLIHQKIVNQQEAVKEISIAMRRARAGIGSEKRPMGTFLFLGPTGVGKTETSKALAEIYFGSQDKMIRIDMSEFQSISDIPRLLGAVSPVEMQGLLTTPVRENPFSLALFDEIEKAHPDILNLFLQILDEGHVTDGQGRKVMFSNTIIICTSNAGAAMIFETLGKNERLDKENIINTLVQKNIFRPEFINRFDATVIFHPLTKENLLQIAQLNLQGLQKKLKEKEIDFAITEPLKAKIVELSYKPEFGAREMRRVIQDKVENVIAQALLSDQLKRGDQFEMSPDFEIAIDTKV